MTTRADIEQWISDEIQACEVRARIMAYDAPSTRQAQPEVRVLGQQIGRLEAVAMLLKTIIPWHQEEGAESTEGGGNMSTYIVETEHNGWIYVEAPTMDLAQQHAQLSGFAVTAVQNCDTEAPGIDLPWEGGTLQKYRYMLFRMVLMIEESAGDAEAAWAWDMLEETVVSDCADDPDFISAMTDHDTMMGH